MVPFAGKAILELAYVNRFFMSNLLVVVGWTLKSAPNQFRGDVAEIKNHSRDVCASTVVYYGGKVFGGGRAHSRIENFKPSPT